MILITQLHTPTLLAALAMSNAIMAGAWWLAFLKTARVGLLPWAGGLLVQALAAAVLTVALYSDSGEPYLVAAGVLVVFGYSLQLRAVTAFLERTTPSWMLYTPAVFAFLVLTGSALAPEASLAVNPASGAWILALHGLTIALSFAFLLIHKTRAHDLSTLDPLTGLYNRRMFSELADAALSRARRSHTCVSVLALDLDRFSA